MSKHGLTVKEVAKLLGVTVRALHHYDEIGILKPSMRTTAGYRIYCDDDIARLRAILELRQSGVKLAQARVLASVEASDRQSLLTKEREALRAQLYSISRRLEGVEMALSVFELRRRVQTEAPQEHLPPAMSHAQRSKLQRLFVLFDANADGYVDSNDFGVIADRLCANSNEVGSGAAPMVLRAHFQAQWDLVRNGSTASVNVAAWLTAHSRALCSPRFDLLVGSFANALFDLVVGKQDGLMKYEHLLRLHAAYRVEPEDAELLWARVPKLLPKSISRDELKTLMLEFYFSDDSEAIGGLLFGRWKHDA